MDPVNVQTFDLRRLDYGATRIFSREDLHSLEDAFVRRLQANASIRLCDVAPEFVQDEFMLALRSYAYGRQKSVEIKTPRTWWDALKLAHAPAWVTRRWPVEYTVHTVQATEVWPSIENMGKEYARMVYVERVWP